MMCITTSLKFLNDDKLNRVHFLNTFDKQRQFNSITKKSYSFLALLPNWW